MYKLYIKKTWIIRSMYFKEIIIYTHFMYLYLSTKYNYNYWLCNYNNIPLNEH